VASALADNVTVDESGPPPLSRKQTWKLVAQVSGGLIVLFVIVGLLGRTVRHDLEQLGLRFVDWLGYPGMGLGTFLADGLHFPIPPQFYMLAVITGGGSVSAALAWIAAGSIVGGHAAYGLAAKAGNIRFIRRRVARVQGTMARLVERWGAGAMVFGSLLPVPYSLLCYLSGLNRLPYRLFALLCLLRIPKLVAYFYLIKAGWNL
jgi:membrane protein YqaA with SNARE-associated domain